MAVTCQSVAGPQSLNESPSKKEGKFAESALGMSGCTRGLNESPSKKEGKFDAVIVNPEDIAGLNESPSK